VPSWKNVKFAIAAIPVLALMGEGAARLAHRMGRYTPKIITESYLQPNPYLYQIPTPGVSVQAHLSRIDINSLGFRNEEFAPRKPLGHYRIFVLGGSTTFGYPGSIPSNQETFPYKLQQELRRRLKTEHIEVINAGVIGYTLRTSLVNYVTRLTWYDPDMLIVHHAVNDAITVKDEDDLQRGVIRANSRPSLWELVRNRSYVLLELSYRYYRYFQRPSPVQQKRTDEPSPTTVRSYDQNLRFLTTLAKSRDVQLVIANEGTIVPGRCDGLSIAGPERAGLESIEKQVCFLLDWYFPHLTATGVRRTFERIAAVQQAVAAENKLLWVDMNQIVPKTSEYYSDVCHTRPAGTTRIASALADLIQSSVESKLGMVQSQSKRSARMPGI
jgi:lysophospholipase L1-like esterase